MKECNPIDRNDLRISRKDRVLEVGGGHNPTRRADVIVEKFVESNYHRGGNLRIFPHQTFINADAEKMPFKDNEFDYLICNHVLEHAEDPIAFTSELQRVAKRGYIEVPSLIGESLFPKESHKWLCLEIDNKLVMYNKDLFPRIYPNFGTTFLNHLPYQCISLRVFYSSCHQVHTVRYEWRDNIDILVNPENDYYRGFFECAWTDQMRDTIFPYRTKFQDFKTSLKAFFHIVKVSITDRFNTQKNISFEEYEALQHAKNKSDLGNNK